jgi:uncharacterized protein YchJ
MTYTLVDDIIGDMEWWACFRQSNEENHYSSKNEEWRIGNSDEKAEPIVRKSKIGRNEPCPCGSGKKYKKCCGV